MRLMNLLLCHHNECCASVAHLSGRLSKITSLDALLVNTVLWPPWVAGCRSALPNRSQPVSAFEVTCSVPIFMSLAAPIYTFELFTASMKSSTSHTYVAISYTVRGRCGQSRL